MKSFVAVTVQVGDGAQNAFIDPERIICIYPEASGSTVCVDRGLEGAMRLRALDAAEDVASNARREIERAALFVAHRTRA